jgi:hypothetical protein
MEVEASVEAFFRDEVDRAFRSKGLSPGVTVEHYIVHLLAGYAAHPIDDAPLALQLASAVEAPPRERRRQLRHIGDTSLYVSGFWGESLEEAAIDVDYYVEMGAIAYGELARLARLWPGGPHEEVFGQLALNFVRFVGALASVSRRTAGGGSNQDIIRLYRRWQATKSESAAARLAALGVVPGRGDGRPQ